jgi:16S rRNA (cytosine1407-C5)-methyltransferase
MKSPDSLLSSKLPAVFLERLQEQFPDDFQSILRTFQRRPPVIRVNTLLATSKEIQVELQEEGIVLQDISELPESFFVLNADRKRLTELPCYKKGMIYIQSIASQLVIKALAPHPGEKILDLCAAPGSKTTQIAIAMRAEGELIANEPKRERFFRLVANLRSQKLEQFVVCKQYPGERYGDYYPGYFDKVLVDAPCSSETRFVLGDIKTTRYWSRHKVKAFARLQRKLLQSAIRCTKPGGLLVYSSCTFAPEENEVVIDWILRKYPELTVEPICYSLRKLPIVQKWNGKNLQLSLQRALRLYPDENSEAFFFVLLRKAKTAD